MAYQAPIIDHEEWRDIPDWNGYQASNLGRIRSLDKTTTQVTQSGARHQVFHIGRIRSVSPCPTTRYLKVGLSKDAKRRTMAVHVLVCAAFHGPRPTSLDVRHINGNRQDNRAANLGYCTRKENLADRAEHGTLNCGERNGRAKLTNAQYEELVRLRRAGVSVRDLSEQFGLTHSTIYGRLAKLPN